MRVGITQRVEYVSSYAESRDCLDQRWHGILELLEMKAVPIPNTLSDIEGWLDALKCDAYILTGGNDLANLPHASNISLERDRTEITLLKYAHSQSLPVFGVCRGLQLMNCFLGGQLERVPGHVATRHSIRVALDKASPLTATEVNSFHEWGLSSNSLAQQLIPWAFDNNDFVEAARHKKLNWLGVMWHPEREEEFKITDLEMIRKLFNEGFV